MVEIFGSMSPDRYQEVMLKKFTGLDGCRFLLEGKKYWIKYDLAISNCYSICKTGELVSIIDLKVHGYN